MEETTIMYSKWNQMKNRYYESGHRCGIKVKPQNADRRIKCDCTVGYRRVTRSWYQPIQRVCECLVRFMNRYMV